MNGTIDVNDILLVLSNFGTVCSDEPLPDEPCQMNLVR